MSSSGPPSTQGQVQTELEIPRIMNAEQMQAYANRVGRTIVSQKAGNVDRMQYEAAALCLIETRIAFTAARLAALDMLREAGDKQDEHCKALRLECSDAFCRMAACQIGRQLDEISSDSAARTIQPNLSVHAVGTTSTVTKGEFDLLAETLFLASDLVSKHNIDPENFAIPELPDKQVVARAEYDMAVKARSQALVDRAMAVKLQEKELQEAMQQLRKQVFKSPHLDALLRRINDCKRAPSEWNSAFYSMLRDRASQYLEGWSRSPLFSGFVMYASDGTPADAEWSSIVYNLYPVPREDAPDEKNEVPEDGYKVSVMIVPPEIVNGPPLDVNLDTEDTATPLAIETSNASSVGHAATPSASSVPAPQAAEISTPAGSDVSDSEEDPVVVSPHTPGVVVSATAAAAAAAVPGTPPPRSAENASLLVGSPSPPLSAGQKRRRRIAKKKKMASAAQGLEPQE